MDSTHISSQQNRVSSLNHADGEMQVLKMKTLNGEIHISKTVYQDCQFGIGDEKELEEYARESHDPADFDHLLAAKAFNICLHSDPEPGKVYVVHSGVNAKSPFRFAQFIGKRIRMGIEYLGWCSMESLDDEWMLIGEEVFGPKDGVLTEYPKGVNNPIVIAEVVRI